MKLIEGAKLKLNEWRDQFKKNKKEVTVFVISALVIIATNRINQYNNNKLAEENKILHGEIMKDRRNMEMMYYIMLRQADSLSIYKTYLINCQDKRIEHTP